MSWSVSRRMILRSAGVSLGGCLAGCSRSTETEVLPLESSTSTGTAVIASTESSQAESSRSRTETPPPTTTAQPPRETPAQGQSTDDATQIERGGADVTVSTSAESGNELSDGSLECAKAATEAVSAHLEAELDDLGDIGIGYGDGPTESDGTVVVVMLVTESRGRDGEVNDTATVDFESVVASTPPTAYVRTEDGDRACAVAVYVEAGVLQLE